MTLIPAVALFGNTLYTVTITGVADVSGNVMSAPVTTTFTTAAGADFTQPVVTLIDPANGSTGVPTNPVIRVQFNKQVAVTSANVELYPTSVGLNIILPGTLVVSANGLSASFTPAAPLQVGTQYGVYLTGITDVTGAAVTTNTYSTFTTGTGTQTTAPTVVAVTPPNGTAGVAVNAKVQVQVSVPVSAVSVGSNSLTLTAGGTAVTGAVSASGSAITFTPAAPLAVSTAYTVAAGGFTDLAGNQVTPFSSSFTTGSSAVADTTPPTVSSVVPANAATKVAVGSPVVVTFNEAVNPLTVGTGTVRISVSGVNLAGTYVVNGAVATSGVTLFVNKSLNAATVPNAVHVSQNGQLVVGTVNVTNNGQTVQFTPTRCRCRTGRWCRCSWTRRQRTRWGTR